MIGKKQEKNFDDDRETVNQGQGFACAESDNPTDAYESLPTSEGFGPYSDCQDDTNAVRNPHGDGQ